MNPLLAQMTVASKTLVYLLPLVAVISIVYSATRHEEWPLICWRAARLAFVILVFMAVILVVIAGIQTHPYLTMGLVGAAMLILFLLQRRSRPAS